MFKRIIDFSLSLILLIILFPFIFLLSIIIFLQDFHQPFYVSWRVGKDKKKFKFYKFRSMMKDSDKLGINSTSIDDNRITKLGIILR